jgi:23S rRNA pseudouridine2605 synthase
MERLNKYLAHAGVASRRKCDELIAAGRVKVDGRVIRDLGTKLEPERHTISVDDAPVRGEKPVYWVVHKPVGYLCTNHDPAGRPLAQDLIPRIEQRVYTVGRLDEASEGLLLMTNDGDLAYKLMHPKFEIEKTYLVLVAGHPTTLDLQKLLDGVWLAEGKVKARRARKVRSQGDSTWLRIVLCEGKNREIRRMLAKLDHKVMKLRRVSIGPIELDRLPKGKARKLALKELEALRKAVDAGGRKLDRLRDRAAGREFPATRSAPGAHG